VAIGWLSRIGTVGQPFSLERRTREDVHPVSAASGELRRQFGHSTITVHLLNGFREIEIWGGTAPDWEVMLEQPQPAEDRMTVR
jgi:hypothetical protein